MSEPTMPHYADEWMTVYVGDNRCVLPTLDSGSVDCIVTSPPYWGLRDYGHEAQIGQERTPGEYVETMVGVFREARRVLKDEGTLWLNLGDSFAGATTGMTRPPEPGHTRDDDGRVKTGRENQHRRPSGVGGTIKAKDLVGIPWRVALALQADGWYLRSDIIWSKPNPMPESVSDRPTRSHEYVFLLSKSPRYYYDAESVREPNVTSGDRREGLGRFAYDGKFDGSKNDGTQQAFVTINPDGRNMRSVWTVPTRPYPGAHFAVFPPDLIKPCILAGAPEGGVILDPFGGSGTTAMVAQSLSRRSVLIELNEDYVGQQMQRNANVPMGL